MPFFAICGLLATQQTPPDMAVLPPKRSLFSTSSTLAPRSCARMAVARPAAPLPITSKSTD
jgi:hypothetical protein